MKGVRTLEVALMLSFFALVMNPWPSFAQKLKFGTGQKLNPLFYLPSLAAEEAGLWKQSGVEAEYFPFDSARDMYYAMASGAVNIALGTAPSYLQSVSRRIPIIAIIETGVKYHWAVWVSPQSRFSRAEDLKGAKIAVVAFGGAQHSYGRIPFKALGWERDVRFVAVGSFRGQVATLKSGAVDALVSSLPSMLGLKVAGEAREALEIDKYLPKKWLFDMAFVRKDFAKNSPDTVKQLTRGFVRGLNYVQDNLGWTAAKLKALSGYPEEGAAFLLKTSPFSRDGRIDGDALQNVVNFLIEYDMVARDSVPPLNELYTREFTG